MRKPHFPLGTKVVLNPSWVAYNSIIKDWEELVTKPYLVVTGHDSNNWMRFDNIEFSDLGGHWNPIAFMKYEIEFEPVKLDEELFRL